jgi:siroheme synthase (precorrin-2 oxidase/ferrochelatase)
MAVDALAGGATHDVAAQKAGVHRVTVTRWALHHPEFRAELNRRMSDAADEASALVVRVTNAALVTIENAVNKGDLDAAFRWLRSVPLTTVTSQPNGPLLSVEVVEQVRQAMPDDVSEVIRKSGEKTTTEAEELVLSRLQGAT